MKKFRMPKVLTIGLIGFVLFMFGGCIESKTKTPLYKDQLRAKMTEAIELKYQIEIGTQVGQYPKSAYDELEMWIDQASDVARDENATQDEINQSTNNLAIAINEFKKSQIK